LAPLQERIGISTTWNGLNRRLASVGDAAATKMPMISPVPGDTVAS